MFESDVLTGLRQSAAVVCGTRTGLATSAELADALRTVRAVTDSLEGLESDLLARFDDSGGYEDQGASSTAAWARQHLRLDAKQARARVRAGHALRQLPDVAEASRAGRIRLDHVKEFAAGITKVGLDVMAEAQDWLLPVAETADPGELRATIAKLADVVHPDRLDEAWANGMDKNDVKVARCGDGFHLSGFLDIVTGTRFKTWLDAAAAPRDADDDRAPSQRRIDAVRQMVTSVLEHGMPTDRGVRPQLHLIVELDTLQGRAGAPPAELSGFGPIGADLLDYLQCLSDVTPILADGHTTGPTPQADVLNVGRTRRLATLRQRAAVRMRQGGLCANPGCSNTHLEIHHVQWWDRDGGRTDLDNLIGLCPRCHHLVHNHQLTVEPDGRGGFVLSRTLRRRIEDHRRTHRHTVRQHLRRLRNTNPQTETARTDVARTAGTETIRAETGPRTETATRTPAPARRRRAIDHGHPHRSIAEIRLHGLTHKPQPHRRT